MVPHRALAAAAVTAVTAVGVASVTCRNSTAAVITLTGLAAYTGLTAAWMVPARVTAHVRRTTAGYPGCGLPFAPPGGNSRGSWTPPELSRS